MKKNKLYIIFSILTLVFFITTSAICTQCSTAAESPIIELQIYDGPDYSESDDMCYYRVEAIVTGDPDPEVEFDPDDNISSLGSGRVEVGVEVGDSYTLTATAKNSAGTATISINLKGDCGEEVVEEEESEESEEEETEEETAEEEISEEEAGEPEEETIEPEPEPEAEAEPETESESLFEYVEISEARLGIVPEETGTIEVGGDLYSFPGDVFVGDWGYFTKYYNGYISFNITDLAGVEVVSVTLTMDLFEEFGDRSHLGYLRIGTLDYGTGLLSISDGDIPAKLLVQFPNSTTDVSYSSSELADELQNKINTATNDRFQLKVYWSHPHANEDEIHDKLLYKQEDIYLIVRYLE